MIGQYDNPDPFDHGKVISLEEQSFGVPQPADQMMKTIDPKKVMELARRAQDAERVALQNAEAGNRKAVIKYQEHSDDAMQELANYLGEPRY